MNAAETLDAYVRAFETLDPDQFLPYYHLPCQFITPAGVIPVTDTAMLQLLAAQFVQQARDQGYVRTETVGPVASRTLSGNLASLAGTFRRLDKDGAEIIRFGFTYLLREAGGDWRITVAAIHDPVDG